MCCYRDIKNFERFNLVVQSMICLAVVQLKNADILVEDHVNRISGVSTEAGSNNNNNNGAGGSAAAPVPAADSGSTTATMDTITAESKDATTESKDDDNDSESTGSSPPPKAEDPWTLSEVEKLLILVAKAFLLNFPLYIAYKHAVHSRLDDISAQDAQVC